MNALICFVVLVSKGDNPVEWLVVVTAFVVGFAMKYGGLCTYAAAVQIVRERRFERLFTFLSAAAWRALIVVPLAWLSDGALHLAATHRDWLAALAGGVVLGLGAYLNRGCVFGTFVQLTGGNLTYLATLLGMASGAVIVTAWLADMSPIVAEPALAAVPSLAALLWLGVAALLLFGRVFEVRLQPKPTVLGLRSLRVSLVALTLGVGGGWLYASVQGWSFPAVIANSAYVAFELRSVGPAMLALLSALAMVAGGITAAVMQHKFSIQPPRLIPSLGSFTGGALMGGAAVIVPGGNDGLLLSGIPALAPHAVTGYLLMLLAMIILLVLLPDRRRC